MTRRTSCSLGRSLFVLATAITAAAALSHRPALARSGAPVEYYRLVPGFVREAALESGGGLTLGSPDHPNPWGCYTAYLMATNRKGQRTWRIENYPPPGGRIPGSTMYLLEGTRQALLIDTANNTPSTPGKDDLNTVVRYLLGHTNEGGVRSNPVDFVVANTHSHGDHTGKNREMADRTVYYPDLDWPAAVAPPNYVPIREGGGATRHGSGQAVGEIDLGDRTIEAIDLYGHTPGSMGYLDRENRLIATGDALGSGLVWMHFGTISQYAESLRHLRTVLRSLDDPAVLPAHFYQVSWGARGKPPLNGRPLDKQYVDDQLAAAEGVLDGSVVAEPYRYVGRAVLVGTVRSAGMTFSPARLQASGTDTTPYRAVRIPGSATLAPVASPIDGIKSGFFMIRDGAGNSLYLIRGSSRALLVGTGGGTPGLARFVRKLVGKTPVDVIVTSEDRGQIGGLTQFAERRIYVPRGASIPRAGLENVSEVWAGDTIQLGADGAGRPLTLQVEPLSGHSRTGLTLLDVSDRVLLSGDALGTQGSDAGLVLHAPLSEFATSLSAWRRRTDGKYDLVYTAHNYEWLTTPAFVDQLQSAVTAGIRGGDAVVTDAAGRKVIRSAGAPDVAATIVLPG